MVFVAVILPSGCVCVCACTVVLLPPVQATLINLMATKLEAGFRPIRRMERFSAAMAVMELGTYTIYHSSKPSLCTGLQDI